MRLLLFSLLLMILTACQSLSVMESSIDKGSLASTYVQTPDPRQSPAPLGQRLIVNWSLPKKIKREDPEKIILTVRFNDYSEKNITYFLKKNSNGYFCYDLLGEEFLEKQGIMTYKAELLSKQGQILIETKQRLWFELIEITPDDL